MASGRRDGGGGDGGAAYTHRSTGDGSSEASPSGASGLDSPWTVAAYGAFRDQCILYEGTNHVVCTATRNRDNAPVIIKYSQSAPGSRQALRREFQLMMWLHAEDSAKYASVGGEPAAQAAATCTTIPKPVAFIDLPLSSAIVFYDTRSVSADKCVAPGQPLPVEAVLRIGHQVALALLHIHERGAVHMDVKPSNILVGGADIASKGSLLSMPPRLWQVQLIDFHLSSFWRPRARAHFGAYAARTASSVSASECGPSSSSTSSRPAPAPEAGSYDHEVPLADYGSAAGTLCYMSPEQTMHASAPIDYRSDLYSLGVCLYELITGQPPFAAPDAQGLILAHLTMVPQPARALNPACPAVLSGIIGKLLMKNPDERYQNTRVLVYDLLQCLELVRLHPHTGFEFSTAQNDHPALMRPISDRLYGRDADINALTAFLKGEPDGGAASRAQLALVTGDVGIGKSACVAHALRHLAVKSAVAPPYFASCKCERQQVALPFAILNSLLEQLLQCILHEPPAIVDAIRTSACTALGAGASDIAAAAPSIARWLDLQHTVESAPLPPAAARLRLFESVAMLLNALRAVPTQRQVLLCDNAQWMDESVLELLQFLLCTANVAHLSVILAYPDASVTGDHALVHFMAAVRDAGTPTHHLSLRALHKSSVRDMVSAMLGEAEPSIVAMLAELLLRKTGGNPLYICQLMQRLSDEELLRFSFRTCQWTLDGAAAEALPVARNMADLLASALRQLPATHVRILQLAACIGYTFDMATLVYASGLSSAHVASVLRDPSVQRFITPLSDGLLVRPLSRGGLLARSAHLDAPSDSDSDTRSSSRSTPLTKSASTTEASADRADVRDEFIDVHGTAQFRFVHDRIHGALMECTGAAERCAAHRSIGRYMLSVFRDRPNDMAARLFEIVAHLNLGRAGQPASTAAPDDTVELAQLNLSAGLRAKAILAYSDALQYADTGLQLLASLDEDARETRQALHFDLAACRAEVLHVLGRLEESSAAFASLMGATRDMPQRMTVMLARLRLYTTQHMFDAAVQLGREVLSELGHPLPDQVSMEYVRADFTELQERIAQECARCNAAGIAELVNGLPAISDWIVGKAVSALLSLLSVSYLAGHFALYALLSIRAVSLILQHGINEASGVALTHVAFVAEAFIAPSEFAVEVAQAGYELAQRSGSRLSLARACMYTGYVSLFMDRIDWTIGLFNEGLSASRDAGDINYSAYFVASTAWIHGFLGSPLRDSCDLYDAHVDDLRRLNHVDVVCAISGLYYGALLLMVRSTPRHARLARLARCCNTPCCSPSRPGRRCRMMIRSFCWRSHDRKTPSCRPLLFCGAVDIVSSSCAPTICCATMISRWRSFALFTMTARSTALLACPPTWNGSRLAR